MENSAATESISPFLMRNKVSREKGPSETKRPRLRSCVTLIRRPSSRYTKGGSKVASITQLPEVALPDKSHDAAPFGKLQEIDAWFVVHHSWLPLATRQFGAAKTVGFCRHWSADVSALDILERTNIRDNK